jgi:hypothetical protein
VETLVVELLQSGEHVPRLISLATIMHAGHYNLPVITKETHAFSGYKKLEERRTERREKREREEERKRVENIERESVRKRRGVIEEIQGLHSGTGEKN